MGSDHDYVKWFRNSAPYINAHRGKTFVLAFGGEAISDPNFANIIHDIALLNSLGVKLVLVHGARPQIEERVRLRGIDSQFANNLRITDSITLESVKDAAGSQRAQIEALLTMGVANSPMHGAKIRVCSGNMVIAQPIGVRNGIDYEHTGLVRRIDSEAVKNHLSDQGIVLLSPLGYSPTGEVFNLSMEDVATQAAVSLRADKLIFFSAANGLLDADQQLLRHCTPDQARELLQTTTDADLQIQLQAILDSLSQVRRCHVISYREDGALLQELFTRDGAGTLVAGDDYEQLRSATIDDVGGILELISPLEANGSLVKRSRELLENEISHFTVIERDGMIIACAALYPYRDYASGEIACVVTHPDYRNNQRGSRLLEALEREARNQHLDKVFVLTTLTSHWFREHGFVDTALQDLPAAKQDTYNLQRNSKIFLKHLR